LDGVPPVPSTLPVEPPVPSSAGAPPEHAQSTRHAAAALAIFKVPFTIDSSVSPVYPDRRRYVTCTGTPACSKLVTSSSPNTPNSTVSPVPSAHRGHRPVRRMVEPTTSVDQVVVSTSPRIPMRTSLVIVPPCSITIVCRKRLWSAPSRGRPNTWYLETS